MVGRLKALVELEGDGHAAHRPAAAKELSRTLAARPPRPLLFFANAQSCICHRAGVLIPQNTAGLQCCSHFVYDADTRRTTLHAALFERRP